MSSESSLNRRQFAAAVAYAALGPRMAGAADQRFVKGICAGIFPRDMPYAERCRQAKNAGFDAIEFAEKHNLTLSKLGDDIDDAASGLTVAEAEAIADEDEDLIFLDVPDDEYRKAPPSSFEPDR